MGLKRWARKWLNEKETERKLQDPDKGQKKNIRVDPQERIAALKAADLDLTIQLQRITGVGSGVATKSWHITEIEPLTFFSIVADTLGGGAYHMTFRKPDATLYRLDGSKEPETHTITVAGKPKSTAEAKEKETAKSGDFWKDLMKEGNVGQMIIKTFLEDRGKPDELLMELLKTAIGGNAGNTDPTTLLTNVTETVVKLREAAGDSGVDPMEYISRFMTMMNQYNLANKPPITTTGSNSTGLDKFFESLGQAAPLLAPVIAGALNKGNGQDTENPASLPAPEPEAQPAFAGTQVATETSRPDPAPGDPLKKVNPLAAFSAQDLGGDPSLSPASAAFGAIMKLRYMIGQEADPLDIASEMVDTINLIKGARRINGAWENFIDDPGVAFDEFAPLIPEWLEKPQYRTDCRAAMVKTLTEYFESDETIDGAEIEIENATHDKESPIEAEAAPDDTVVATVHDEGQNGNGIIDG